MAKIDKAWERRKGESAQAYEAFTAYRDMGADRSIRAVSQKLAKSKTIIDRWSRVHEWVERCRAWDNELDKQAQAKAVKDRKAMIERHIGIAVQLQAKALQALQLLKVEDMTPKDIVTMVDVSAKLERLSRGEVTERTEIEGDVSLQPPPIDLSGISDEELAKLDEITGKIFGE